MVRSTETSQAKSRALNTVTKKGTIVSKMSTSGNSSNLSASLFGKTRRAVLSLLYSQADEAFYLRQIARAAGGGLGAVQRELRQLSDAGIIQRTAKGRQVYYQANPKCPIFPELKSLMVKTAGVGDILRSALAPLVDRIAVAFIYGSIAHGEEYRDSDVDVLIIGNATFAEVVDALSPAQETLGREINPTVYPPTEFESKVAEGHHFLKSVLSEGKIYLIGDEDQLARLAGKGLAD